MIEWRIFLKPNENHKLVGKGKKFEDLFAEITPEERKDIYFNLDSEDLGLKERHSLSDAIQSILELKIRNKDYKGFGELWEKPLKHTFINHNKEDQSLTDQELQDYLFMFESENPHIATEEIKNIQNSLKDNHPERLSFYKTRFQIIINEEENIVKIEKTLFHVMTQRWVTFAIESRKEELVKKFKEKYFPGKKKINEIEASYPGFIKKLLSEHFKF
ncbi:MAG: hypothetical protein ACTSVU_09905 [Promethearchaeota archaeon]